MKQNARWITGVVAVLALLALAAPSLASAAVWKKGGVTVTSSFSLGLTGRQTYEFEDLKGNTGGVSCNEHLTMAYNSATKATTITNVSFSGCKTFGTLSGCSIQTTDALGLPWAVTLNPTDLTVSSMHVQNVFKTGCANKEINQTIAMPMTPDNTATIHSLELFESVGSFYRQYGAFTVDSPNSGVYGIG